MSNWLDVLLTPSSSIVDAIKLLDDSGMRIVLVVDEDRKLLGTVTDGDIRRGLIRRCPIESPVTEVMCTEPTVASANEDQAALLNKMRLHDFLHVPLVDSQGHVVGLETLQHLLDEKKYGNPVFLMAGGFGTRLRPLTDDCPKPLLKVGKKPILQTILEQFIDAGFYNFYISTHYKADLVMDHFEDGSDWGVNISYIHEKQPLGTAGALSLLPLEALDMPLVVMNGDLLTKVNFSHLLEFHEEQGAKATMCVREYDLQVPYGVVEAVGHKVSSIVEKPVQRFFVNAGIYVLDPVLVRKQKGSGSLDMTDLLGSLIDKGDDVSMFPVHEYWLDIGHLDEYERAQQDVNYVFS